MLSVGLARSCKYIHLTWEDEMTKIEGSLVALVKRQATKKRIKQNKNRDVRPIYVVDSISPT